MLYVDILFIAGLIHANHGGEITDYLLNQLKDASTDVSTAMFISITVFNQINAPGALQIVKVMIIESCKSS